MFTCKQVSNSLSKEDYKNLPFLRRALIRLHVTLCVFCGRFNKQVIDSQEMCSCYKEQEEKLAEHRENMPNEKKEELKKLLSEQSK